MIRVFGRFTSNKRQDIPVLRGLPSRYKVVRELGYGGMAVVYLARDRQLDRDVAIKVLHSALSADRASVARLSQEARLVAQLHHPNIVSIYDLERLRDKSVALVMQYVRGRTLRSLIEEHGRLSVVLVERVLTEIAKALLAAHRRGIIHRDVKPENIYLDQESGRALLADFGIAQAPLIQSGLTLAGEAMGTPNYMSPEQITGSDVDGRSDLYSLGLVGYEMLTGEQPWAGESLYNMLYKQQHENLPSLSSKRPDVTPGLARAIEQAMTKDRSLRPASAEDMIRLLRQATAEGEQSTSVAPEGVPDAPPIAAPDAPTVRYRRSGTVTPEGDGFDSSSRAVPIQLFPWEDEPTGGETPAEARSASLPPKVSSPTFSGVRTSRVPSGEARVEKKKQAQSRGALVIFGASAAVASLVAVVGFITMAGRPTAQAGSIEPPPLVIETPPEVEIAPPPASSSGGGSSSGPAPSPRRSGPVGSRRASDAFNTRGDLTDVVCQPLRDETVAEWMARVPSYCQR